MGRMGESRTAGHKRGKRTHRKVAECPDLIKDASHIRALLEDRLQFDAQKSTPTLVFFIDRKQLKVCLNDRGGARSIFKSCDSPAHGIELLDRELGQVDPDWRPYRPWADVAVGVQKVI